MPQLTTNKLGGKLMYIDTVDSKYNAYRYSIAGLAEVATVSSQSCAEDPSDDGTLPVTNKHHHSFTLVINVSMRIMHEDLCVVHFLK